MQAQPTFLERLQLASQTFREGFARGDWAAIQAAMARGEKHYSHQSVSYEDMTAAQEVTLHMDASDIFLADLSGQPVAASHAVAVERHLRGTLGKASNRGGSGGVAGAIDALCTQMDERSSDHIKCSDDDFDAAGAGKLGSPLLRLFRTRDWARGVHGAGTEHERYSAGAGFWISSGMQATAGHVDFAHVIACMPRCCNAAVKLWVVFTERGAFENGLVWPHVGSHEAAFARAAARANARVVVMLPGDVIAQPPMVWHAVLTRCRPGTAPGDQWAMIGGVDIVRKTFEDARVCLQYATRGVSGEQRISALLCDAERYADTILRAHWELWCKRGAFSPSAALQALRTHVAKHSTQYARTAAAANRAHEKSRERKRLARARGLAAAAKRARLCDQCD